MESFTAIVPVLVSADITAGWCDRVGGPYNNVLIRNDVDQPLQAQMELKASSLFDRQAVNRRQHKSNMISCTLQIPVTASPIQGCPSLQQTGLKESSSRSTIHRSLSQQIRATFHYPWLPWIFRHIPLMCNQNLIRGIFTPGQRFIGSLQQHLVSPAGRNKCGCAWSSRAFGGLVFVQQHLYEWQDERFLSRTLKIKAIQFTCLLSLGLMLY